MIADLLVYIGLPTLGVLVILTDAARRERKGGDV